MAIRYKVVTKDRLSICTYSKPIWSLKYEKNSIVEANDSLGIFVFRTRRQAWKFLHIEDRGMILRVKTLSRGRSLYLRPTHYGNRTLKFLTDNYKEFLKAQKKFKDGDLLLSDWLSSYTKEYAPGYINIGLFRTNSYGSIPRNYDGTMVYPKIKVLD